MTPKEVGGLKEEVLGKIKASRATNAIIDIIAVVSDPKKTGKKFADVKDDPVLKRLVEKYRLTNSLEVELMTGLDILSRLKELNKYDEKNHLQESQNFIARQTSGRGVFRRGLDDVMPLGSLKD